MPSIDWTFFICHLVLRFKEGSSNEFIVELRIYHRLHYFDVFIHELFFSEISKHSTSTKVQTGYQSHSIIFTTNVYQGRSILLIKAHASSSQLISIPTNIKSSPFNLCCFFCLHHQFISTLLIIQDFDLKLSVEF